METAKEKYKIIDETVSHDNNLLSISQLCSIAEVSRSGYYSWKSHKNKRNEKEEKDRQDFDLILIAYRYRGYDKGARSIYMRLLHMDIVMNLKKIRRLMKKYNLVCKIRKANPYRRMAKAMKTSNVAGNLVNRQFRQEPRLVILTDITYLFYGKKKEKAYLSVMKDAFTNEILAYTLSQSLEVDFVLMMVHQLFDKHGDTIKANETIIHSDQGAHYTSVAFQKLINDKALRQSMSRRGNCWDNAPQESFFGHMKDEISERVECCRTFEELLDIIDDYMEYYNNERYQWNLAKLSPSEYYQYYTSGIYPIQAKKDDTIQK